MKVGHKCDVAGVKWLHVIEDSVNRILNNQVPQKAGNSLVTFSTQNLFLHQFDYLCAEYKLEEKALLFQLKIKMSGKVRFRANW